MTTESQTTQILNHMLCGAEITAIEAFRFFGCTRLAARILDIKNMGYHVNRVTVVKNKKHFTAYSLNHTEL